MSNSQNIINVKIGNNYQFINNHSILENKDSTLISVYDKLKIYKKIGKRMTESVIENELIQSGLVIKVQNIDNGNVYFTYWPFDLESEENKIKESIYNAYGKVYSLPVDQFSKLTDERFSSFMGWFIKPFTVPIRLRGVGSENFEFETNLSIGTSITTGWRYNLTKENRYLEGTAGLGISKVNLKPSNSNLEIETLSPVAFTIALGFLFHYDKVNLGFFMGWDSILGEEQVKYNWVHNRKTWIGLGLNIGLGNAINGAKQKEGNQPKG